MRLQVKNLTYKYMPGTNLEQEALKNVSVEAEAGSFIGLIGHTGSGKSTFMQLLDGLLTPTGGAVYFDDLNIHASKDNLRLIRKKIGYIFQYPEHQLFESSILEDVSFGPRNLGLPADEVEKRAVEALLGVGIEQELFKKSPFELSGGQKRRVAIAGVLAMQPEVLILDEPAAGLDPKGKNEIMDKIKELHKRYHMTIILVSHSMEDIARLADTVWVMHQGEIMMTGTPAEVFSNGAQLNKIGLSLPESSTLLQSLQDKGFDVTLDKFTVADVAQAIVTALKPRGAAKGGN